MKSETTLRNSNNSSYLDSSEVRCQQQLQTNAPGKLDLHTTRRRGTRNVECEVVICCISTGGEISSFE